MFILARTITYASAFIAFLLVFVPARILARSGIMSPESIGAFQISGMILVVAGSILMITCILTFSFIGRGTPAPFDPPTRLVDQGPYRFLRNPMYLGAGIALSGAAAYYASIALLTYVGIFLFAMHLLVIFYEEPTLRETFGDAYRDYQKRVSRWWPHF